ncbi:MAG: polyprenyl synthetase family protein [Lachnospiraceae bacterium]|nr:polyprenyl synthetase family protein [Lachnospiraceae bacterium]
MTFEEEFALRKEAIEEIIERYLPEESGFQKTVLQAGNYSVRAGGKRLRPMIMLETYRLFDGRSKAIEPFLAAIEMIHTSSLIHDDLPCMDNDVLRRGQPSCWAKFGEDMGVLAGDSLLIYAVETACRSFSLNADPKAVGEAIRILSSKTGIHGMIGGQTLDVEKTGKPLSEAELDFIYRLKTGALIEASMMIGAVLAGASQENIDTCERIARNVGVAFQIQDDILDVTSTTEELGKPVHSDEVNEKFTYVTIYGLEKAREEVERLTEEAVEDLSKLTGENEFLKTLLLKLVGRTK